MSNEITGIPQTNYRQNFSHVKFASPELLNPLNHTLILIDHEGQMAFPTESTPRLELRNNLATTNRQRYDN